jgi:hypothetical protein
VTDINDISSEIANELRRYTHVLEEDVQKAIQETSKGLVQDLKTHSPENTGNYAKGWRIKKQGKLKNIVHNKTDYRLTHLLEHGHAKRGGGRVAAQVHIEPAEQRAIAEFLDKIERAIQND